MAVFLGIPYFGYIAGGIGIVAVIILIYWLLGKTRQGRIGEEQQEERETERLEYDEAITEATQRDEKKQCKILDDLFSDIIVILRNSGNNVLVDQLSGARQRISKILLAEMSEKMSVKAALQTFKELHALINEFLAMLPKDNRQINELAGEIEKHQQKYYQDLIKELSMDEDEKKQLRKLWAQVQDEETGQGYLQAA